MKKKLLAGITAMTIALGLSGCSEESAGADTPKQAQASTTYSTYAVYTVTSEGQTDRYMGPVSEYGDVDWVILPRQGNAYSTYRGTCGIRFVLKDRSVEYLSGKIVKQTMSRDKAVSLSESDPAIILAPGCDW